MKFDVRSGTQAVPLWRYDPKIKQARTQRGIAMYGNKVFIPTNDMRMIAVNRDSGDGGLGSQTPRRRPIPRPARPHPRRKASRLRR